MWNGRLPLLTAPWKRQLCPSSAALRVASLALILSAPLVSFPASVMAADPPPAKQQPKKKEAPKEDPEVKMGREAHEEMVKSGLKLVTDPAILGRVEGIGKKIAAITNDTKLPASYGSSELVPYDYKFFVVDDDDVNAFSLPGGYIYINKGLLKYIQSDDELAGVLGHEIIHAAHHHVARLQREQSRLNTQMLAGALVALVARVPTGDALNLFQGFQLIALQKVNGYGQDAERDADRAGLIVAQKAGYNPVGMLTFMERLARDQRMRPEVELGIFRTHPPEKERVANLLGQIQGLGLPVNRRAVTNILKVAVRPVSVGKEAGKEITAYEVTLEKRGVFRTASEARAKQVCETLDRMLNSPLEIYEVKRSGPTVLVRGEPLVTVAGEDLPLPGSPTEAEAVAAGVHKAVRLALYRNSIENNL